MENKIISWLEDKELTPEEIFHALYHFSRVWGETREFLLAAGEYSDDQINAQLNTGGSKFFSCFAKSPGELLARIRVLLKIPGAVEIIRESPQRFHLQFTLAEDRWCGGSGIGSDNILSLDEIPPLERPNIRSSVSRQNKWVQIRELPWVDTKKTNTFHLVVIDTEGSLKLATIFPGTYAPPFPNKEWQDERGFQASLKFWQKHVFIVAE